MDDDWMERMEVNDNRALVINSMLSMARDLSSSRLGNVGDNPRTILITMMQTPTMVAELGSM